MKYISNSQEQTELFAQEKIAPLLHGGEVIALFGPMGMGKTAFVRGLARGLSSVDRVCSPTFAITNVYRCNGQIKSLAHFDVFRINFDDELEATGFFEYIESGAVVVCEWSENITQVLDYLQSKVIKIVISMGENENQRLLSIL